MVGVLIPNLLIKPLLVLAWFATILLMGVLLIYIFIIVKNRNLIQPIAIYSLTSAGYVVGSLFLLMGGQSRSLSYFVDNGNLPYFMMSLLNALIGVICFGVAYFYILNRGTSRSITSLAIFRGQPIYLGRLRLVVIILYIFGFVGYILLVETLGGLFYLVGHINQTDLHTGNGYYRLWFQFMQAANFVWLAYDINASRRILFWFMVGINLFCLTTLGAAAPVILFITSIIALMMHRMEILNPKSIGLWATKLIRSSLIVGVIVFIALIGRVAWRESSSSAYRSTGSLDLPLILERAIFYTQQEDYLASTVFGGANLASIEALSTVVEAVPDKLPYLNGETLYSVILAPVPRALWPNKPASSTGLLLKRSLSNSSAQSGGVPPTWIGELYLNFGSFGVIIGCLLFGYISANITRWYYAHAGNALALLIFVQYSVSFTFYLTKVEFKTALNRGLTPVFTFLIAYFILKAFNSFQRPYNQKVNLLNKIYDGSEEGAVAKEGIYRQNNRVRSQRSQISFKYE